MKLEMVIGKYNIKMVEDGYFVSGISFSSVTGKYGLSGGLLDEHFSGKDSRRLRRLLKICTGVY